MRELRHREIEEPVEVSEGLQVELRHSCPVSVFFVPHRNVSWKGGMRSRSGKWLGESGSGDRR